MRKTIVLALIAGNLALSPARAQVEGGAAEPTPLPAETIYTNGRIYTPLGWKADVAIAHGTIVAVGAPGDMKPYRAAATRIVDLGGATVLPGLIDMHVHAITAGLNAGRCMFPQDSTPAEIAKAVGACAAKAEPGAWIVGGQWAEASFGGQAPKRAFLDRAAPNNPVVLRDLSLHSAWLNSAALKLVGITRDTPSPAGGLIEKDSAGEPTGFLRENAAIAMLDKLPQPGEKENEAALVRATRTLLSLGVTAYEDALLTAPGAKAYAALADRGALFQHVRICMWEADQALIRSRNLYARDGLDLSCVKMMLDGVPTDAHTAAMAADYADAAAMHEPAKKKGTLMVAAPEITSKVVRYDAAGLLVKMHATGDAAVHAAIDAIVAARQANGISGMRHEVTHANFVLPEDFARARANGATFEFSPYVWFPNPVMNDVAKAIGPARMAHFSPVKTAIDAGAFVVIGSDWPVVPAADPWLAIETLVTRQAPGGVGEPVSPLEKISVAEAVQLMTRNAARQLGIEDRTGTIEQGKQADMIVTDRDIFAIPASDIHNTKVLRTLVAGVERFTAGAPQ